VFKYLLFEVLFLMHRDFDELELYFDPAMVDQVEQEYNHRRIYWKYSIRTIIDNQKNNEKNKRLPFEL
jgi:hypothetical protein